MTTDDDEPTEAELREAAALARALDGGRGDPEMPDDALGTAAYLQYAKDGGALDSDRAHAILTDALARARPPRAQPSWRWRIFGALGLAAAGAALVLIVARAPIGEVPDTLPAPPRALLEAQIDAAGGRVASLDALTAETRDYRATVYGALHDRYGR